MGYVGEFFPPDDPLSKFVAAFLLRADELRLLVEKHGAASSEAHSRKDIHWLFLLIRLKTVAVDDAAEILNRLQGEDRFMEALRSNPERAAEFDAALDRLANSAHAWSHVRNSTAGHVDVGRLQQALEDYADDVLGTITISHRSDTRSWGVLHPLVGIMLHRKRRRDLGELKPVFDAMQEGLAAVFILEGLIAWTWNDLRAGAFFQAPPV